MQENQTNFWLCRLLIIFELEIWTKTVPNVQNKSSEFLHEMVCTWRIFKTTWQALKSFSQKLFNDKMIARELRARSVLNKRIQASFLLHFQCFLIPIDP